MERKMRIWKTKMSNFGYLCFGFLLLFRLFSGVGLRCFWPKPTLFTVPNSLQTTSKHRMREYWRSQFHEFQNYVFADMNIWTVSSVLELCSWLVCLAQLFPGWCRKSETCQNWNWTKMENHLLLFSKKKVGKTDVSSISSEKQSTMVGEPWRVEGRFVLSVSCRAWISLATLKYLYTTSVFFRREIHSAIKTLEIYSVWDFAHAVNGREVSHIDCPVDQTSHFGWFFCNFRVLKIYVSKSKQRDLKPQITTFGTRTSLARARSQEWSGWCSDPSRALNFAGNLIPGQPETSVFCLETIFFDYKKYQN